MLRASQIIWFQAEFLLGEIDMALRKPKSLYLLNDNARKLVYTSDVGERLQACCDFYAEPQTSDTVARHPEVLEAAEVIFSGWGTPTMDAAFLSHAKNLKIVCHGAGTIRQIVTDDFWERGLRITTAVQANAIPVAQFALGQILFCLKFGWQHNQRSKANIRQQLPAPGAWGSKVGLVSFGNIAKLVSEMLPQEIEILVYDPYFNQAQCTDPRVRSVSLETLFSESHVVSLHTPNLPATRGMIDRKLLDRLRPYASIINTARSAVLRHDHLIEVLQSRPDLWAILDVFEDVDEALQTQLRALPNTSLTPHIAGSLNAECLRMGQYIVEEVSRYIHDQPLQYEITQNQHTIMA